MTMSLELDFIQSKERQRIDMAAPLAPNEQARLDILHQLHILDTAPEVSFDELTKLAAQICECPISVISLVDNDRQWFKSTFNVSATETPRADSFCAFTILEPEILIVPDSHVDDRFKNMNTVTGPLQLHFYAGVPITYQPGINLGAICVIDSKPHPELSEFQKEALKGLAKLAAKLIDGRKSFIDLQSMSKAMIEAEKNLALDAQMKALAEMTAGVAHEINNPLAIIKMTLEILKDTLIPKMITSDKEVEQFNRLEKAAERIQNLTHGLMTYSRDSRKDIPSETLFKNVITDTLQFCKVRLEKSGTELIIEEFNPRLSMECNPVEISQVLLNLVHNACDAVTELPERWVRIHLSETDSQIQLSVTDSGHGIPSHVADEMFQPFFTTKKVNHGTGLGLSICRGIIERHHGTIEIDQTSSNTRFVITLPKRQSRSISKAG